MKILVADDNKDTLHLLNLILSNKGHSVQLALNKKETLLLAKSFKPDLLLLDAHLGEEDGIEVCLAIKTHSKTKYTRVIIMTGYEVTEEEATICRADALLPKPFSIKDLLLQIEKFATSHPAS